jgi:hypothetical protein
MLPAAGDGLGKPAPAVGANLTILSLGAGVQSTALFLLGCEGRLVPKLDAAVFADTGWEPKHVYQHLERLCQHGDEHGVPVYLASKGNLPSDVLNRRVFATVPAYTIQSRTKKVPVAFEPCLTCGLTDPLTFDDDEEVCADCDNTRMVPTRWETRPLSDVNGMVRRQCTSKYKIEPISAQVRLLLGASTEIRQCRYCDGRGLRVAPWDPAAGEGECSICRGSGKRRLVGRAPTGATAEQWIGFSTDEIERVTTAGFPKYQKPRHPLLELDWSRDNCEEFLTEQGWSAEKSACLGCPYHDDDVWVDMMVRDPDEFAATVAFDEALRSSHTGMRNRRFLHESRIPLREAVEKAVRKRTAAGEQPWLFGEKPRKRPRGCSPSGCPSGEDAA